MVLVVAANAVVQLSVYFAPVSSIVLCCSPIPTIQHIIVDEKIGHYPLLPYTILLINTMLWFAYGILRHDTSLWITNGVSILFATYYWYNYMRYAHTATSRTILPGSVHEHATAIIITIITIVLWLILPFGKSHSRWLGLIAMLSGIILYASPLAALKFVTESKCSRSIPLPFTIASLFSCSLWIIYGIFQTNDLNVYIPGIIGFTLSLAQLSLKLYYGDNLLNEIQDDIHVMIDERYDHMEKVPILLESECKRPKTSYHTLM
jgi:solute carrier family 50 (sugar transporter)